MVPLSYISRQRQFEKSRLAIYIVYILQPIVPGGKRSRHSNAKFRQNLAEQRGRRTAICKHGVNETGITPKWTTRVTLDMVLYMDTAVNYTLINLYQYGKINVPKSDLEAACRDSSIRTTHRP